MTPDDVIATVSDWVDLYSTTGITTGKALRIQNKSNTIVILKESVSKPTGLSGYEVWPFSESSSDIIISEGSDGAWVRAKDTDSHISVQEV